MLTTKNTSAKKASEYFLQGYYQEGTSRWFGIGALKLGLAGAVENEEVFNNIVQGKSPDGTQQLSASHTKAESRRAALDCTFEAPKSISITALPGKDERLVQCHVEAAEQTLALIQERCAHTRVTIDKERHLVNTKNLVVAQFDHIESRELDPHLHTHCLLMNMVQTAEGKWYSHVNDAIFEQKKYWGMVYQQFLAQSVQKLGYEIEWKAHGQFELKGYTEEEIKEFSKRRQQILAFAGHNSTWAEREEAWRATRKRKQEVKKDELLARWIEEASLLGIQFVQPTMPPVEIEQTAPQQQKRQVESLPVTQLISQKLVDDAIRHCSSKKVSFALEDLERFVLETVGTTIDPKQLKALFCSHPELKRLELKQGVRYTTQTALWQDRATIHLMRQGQGAVAAIAPLDEVKAHLEQTGLNAGQREAVMLAARTTDQFMLLEGVAGSGKTWMLRELKAIAQPRDYIFKGFGVTSDAEKELWKKAGIESTTLASLLCDKLPSKPQPNQIWVVDEAGMSSAKDCYHLLKRATAEGARVILVGDKRQFSAVEAGNPFKLLQLEGILTAYMDESVRQKNPELKVAVDLIAQGKIEQGFARLEDSGKIVSCDAERQAAAIVGEYMKVVPEKRADTLVLVGTHKERLLITPAIRNALKAEGSLGQEEARLTALYSIENKNDLSKVKLEYTHNFEIGNIVIPTRNYKRRQLEKGVAYEVVGKTKDRLHLKTYDGNVLTVNPKFDKSVYSQQEIAIAVGDRLRWTKRSKNLVRYNGDELLVTAVEGNQATLQYVGTDRTETIDLTQPQHLDHNIVRTGYSAQGKDAEIVLIAADQCVSTESFYVAVSRAKQELKLFTQDSETLLTQALVSKANKSALDEWREHIEQQMKAQAAAQLKSASLALSIQEIVVGQLAANLESLDVREPSEDKPEIASEDNSQPLREGFDAASLGQSIAQQLKAGFEVELQSGSTELLRKASTRRQQLKLPIPQLQLKQNPPIPIPLLQGKTNQLLNTAQDSDRTNSLQLDRIEQLQRQANRATDLACSRLEEISRHQPVTPPELTAEQVPTTPEHQEITNDSTTTRNAQQPRTIDGTSIGRSIANRLETSNDRIGRNQSRAEQLLIRARSSGRAHRSIGAIEQFSYRILQSGVNANQQRSRLPIPTSGRTQATRIQRDADESDWSVARQLEQIDQRQRTANTQTERTLTRLGNYHADFTAADEAAIPTLTDSRAIGTDARDRATQGQPAAANSNNQQQPAVNLHPTEQPQLHEIPPTAVEQLPPQVFMGSQPQPDQIQLLQNHGAVYKPTGGIWTSNYQPDYGSEWSAFVHKEEMSVNPHKQHLWLIIPKHDLKILVVDSPEKLKSLPHLAPHIEGDNVCPLDYEAIALKYDALVIKPQLLRGCMEVASFDVESTIWFGSRGYPFASVERLMLPVANQQTSQSTVDSASNDLSTDTYPNQEKPSVTETETTKHLKHWKQVAQALGKPQAYINRIAATARVVKIGVSLPESAIPAMQHDLQTYLKFGNFLKQWYDAAASLGKSEQYLDEIVEIVKAFYHPTQPKPLTSKAAAAMQKDINNCKPAIVHAPTNESLADETHLLPLEEPKKDWQYYSRFATSVNHLVRGREVALAALNDGMKPEQVRRLLATNPDWQKEKPEILHGHIESTMRYVEFLVDSQKSGQQQINQEQYQQQGYEGVSLF